MWLFGDVQYNEVHIATANKIGGFIELQNARVQWFLSIDRDDLPREISAKGQPTFRSITINGEEVEFSGGFTDLHTIVYKEILAGNGFGLDEARPSIVLVHSIRVYSLPHAKVDYLRAPVAQLAEQLTLNQ